MDFGDFGLREAVFAFCAVAAIYVVAMLGWLYRVEKAAKRKTKRSEPPAMVAPTVSGPAEADEVAEGDLPSVYDRPRVASVVAEEGFGQHLQRSQHDQEVRLLREEVGALRDELLNLRDEVAAQKAAGLVSPQYSEAVAMAQRGLSARDVADRCGISLGEAELVRALARGPANFDDEEFYGGDSRRLQSAA